MDKQINIILLNLVCSFIFGPFQIYGQENSVSLSFDHLTVDDGLSHSTVNTILEDHLGIIWMGTRFGLNRYDGYEFKVFLPDRNNPNAIKSQSILTLWEDSLGNIWSGHLNEGISVWERGTERFLRFPFHEDQSIDWQTTSVRRFFQDKRGNLWIGTYEEGAVVFDPSWNRIAHFCTSCEPANRKLSNDFVFDFQEDTYGRIWIGTDGKGVNVYDPKEDTITTVHSDDQEDMDGFGKSLCLAPSGHLWVGTAGSGIYEIDCKTLRVIQKIQSSGQLSQGLSHSIITDLNFDKNGDLWIATDGGGLNRFSPSTNHWLHFSYSSDYLNALNTNALYDLMFDKQGNLWIATYNGGVNLHKTFTPPFFMDREYFAEKSQGLRPVLSLHQDQNEQIWLGTDGGGLFRLDLETKPIKLVAIEKSLQLATHEPVIKSIAASPEGGLWLGTFARGLFYFDKQKGLVQRYQNNPEDAGSLSHNNVWDMEPASDGGLWIGTLGGGVNYLGAGQTTFRRFIADPDTPNSLSGIQVIDILLDQKRQGLWVATESTGLNHIDLSNTTYQITQFHHDESDSLSLSSEKLRCLFEDNEGTIWIGTEDGGLNAFQPSTGKFSIYTMEDGLPSNMINSIIQGPQGYFWISTQAGIVRWRKEDRQVVNIGSEAYLENNQYNPGAALKLKDGRLLLGSTNGFSIILPDQLRLNTNPPNVVFTELNLSNQPIPIGKFKNRIILSGPLNDDQTIVRLSYKDKGIQVNFTATDYTQPEKNQYAYRLMGFDTTWRIVGPEQRFAIYSTLPGGKYELQVKAANNNGTWSVHPKTLAIEVSPPFWQTWWFFFLWLFIGLLFIYGVFLLLLKRQKAEYQRQAIQSEQEILRLRNENLEKDISSKQSRLNASILQIAHHNEILNDLKEQIISIESQNKKDNSRALQKVLLKINDELSQENYWEQFLLVFDQTFQNFITQIQLAHPKLTSNDHRLCCFIKMQLNNREIASILNITINGVEQGKYRLKKKLALAKEESLTKYIKKFGQQ